MRRGSASRRSEDWELGSAASPRSLPKSPRRGSIQGRKTSVLLPQLSVKDEALHPEVLPSDAAELALDPLSTLVPDLLVPPNKSQVRGWSSEDDHFEVRVWASCPLQRRPVLLTEPKAVAAWSHLTIGIPLG
eukprot:Skav211125  [mRNA]  locus=scaffold3631:103347:105007:- [translate_table: standard]